MRIRWLAALTMTAVANAFLAERSLQPTRTEPADDLRSLLREVGMPPYLLPPDSALARVEMTTSSGKRSSHLGVESSVDTQLDRRYNRNIDIWDVSWSPHIRASVRKGHVDLYEGIDAGTNALPGMKGLKVRVTRIELDPQTPGILRFTVKPRFLPSFVVRLPATYFDSDACWA